MFTHPKNTILTRIFKIFLRFDLACSHKSTPYLMTHFGVLKPRLMSEDLR